MTGGFSLVRPEGESPQAAGQSPVIPCPVCGSRSSEPHFAPPLPGWLRCCGSCGLLYFDHPEPLLDPVELYSRAYEGLEPAAGMDEFRARMVIRADIIRSNINIDRVLKGPQYEAARLIEKLAPVGSRVLDIGCGPGYFLRAIRRRGYEGYGLDVAKRVTDALQAEGYPAWNGPIETIPDNWVEPDVCTSFFMLHHVSDPVGFIRAVRTRFPHAVFILSVMDHLDNGHVQDNLADTAYPRTYTAWGKTQLELAFRQAGFEHVTVTHVMAQPRGYLVPTVGSLYARLQPRFPAAAPHLISAYYKSLPLVGELGAFWYRRRKKSSSLMAVAYPNDSKSPTEP